MSKNYISPFLQFILYDDFGIKRATYNRHLYIGTKLASLHEVLLCNKTQSLTARKKVHMRELFQKYLTLLFSHSQPGRANPLFQTLQTTSVLSEVVSSLVPLRCLRSGSASERVGLLFQASLSQPPQSHIPYSFVKIAVSFFKSVAISKFSSIRLEILSISPTST